MGRECVNAKHGVLCVSAPRRRAGTSYTKLGSHPGAQSDPYKAMRRTMLSWACCAAVVGSPVSQDARVLRAEKAESGVVKTSWIHVPKTASTFANTIYRYGCSGIDNSTVIEGDTAPIWDYTIPYPPETYCTLGPMTDIDKLDEHWPWFTPTAGSLITMLRDPRGQKLSQLEYTMEKAKGWLEGTLSSTPIEMCGLLEGTWFNNYTEAGMSQEDKGAMHAICEQAMVSTSLELEFPTDMARCPFLDAVLPHMSGCQSKMTVFGEGCLQGALSKETSTERAKTVYETLPPLYAFSAITERYNESVCLFQQLFSDDLMSTYGDNKQPIAAQFSEGRSSDDSGVDWELQVRMSSRSWRHACAGCLCGVLVPGACAGCLCRVLVPGA